MPGHYGEIQIRVLNFIAELSMELWKEKRLHSPPPRGSSEERARSQVVSGFWDSQVWHWAPHPQHLFTLLGPAP